MSSARWAPPSATLRSTSSADPRLLNVRSTRSSASSWKPRPPPSGVESTRWSPPGGLHCSSFFFAAIGLGFRGCFQTGCPQELIGPGFGLLVLVERGGRLRAGRTGACECGDGLGAFFRDARTTPPVVRPGVCRVPGCRAVAGAGSSRGPWATARSHVPSWSRAASRAAASNIRRVCSTVSTPVSNSRRRRPSFGPERNGCESGAASRRRARRRRTAGSPIAPYTARHASGPPERPATRRARSYRGAVRFGSSGGRPSASRTAFLVRWPSASSRQERPRSRSSPASGGHAEIQASGMLPGTRSTGASTTPSTRPTPSPTSADQARHGRSRHPRGVGDGPGHLRGTGPARGRTCRRSRKASPSRGSGRAARAEQAARAGVFPPPFPALSRCFPGRASGEGER